MPPLARLLCSHCHPGPFYLHALWCSGAHTHKHRVAGGAIPKMGQMWMEAKRGTPPCSQAGRWQARGSVPLGTCAACLLWHRAHLTPTAVWGAQRG